MGRLKKRRTINEIMKKKNIRCGVSSKENPKQLFTPIIYDEKKDRWYGYTYSIESRRITSESLSDWRRGNNAIYTVLDKEAPTPHINSKLSKQIHYSKQREKTEEDIQEVDTLSEVDILTILNVFEYVVETLKKEDIPPNLVGLSTWEVKFMTDMTAFLYGRRIKLMSIKQKITVEAVIDKLDKKEIVKKLQSIKYI